MCGAKGNKDNKGYCGYWMLTWLWVRLVRAATSPENDPNTLPEEAGAAKTLSSQFPPARKTVRLFLPDSHALPGVASHLLASYGDAVAVLLSDARFSRALRPLLNKLVRESAGCC